MVSEDSVVVHLKPVDHDDMEVEDDDNEFNSHQDFAIWRHLITRKKGPLWGFLLLLAFISKDRNIALILIAYTLYLTIVILLPLFSTKRRSNIKGLLKPLSMRSSQPYVTKISTFSGYRATFPCRRITWHSWQAIALNCMICRQVNYQSVYRSHLVRESCLLKSKQKRTSRNRIVRTTSINFRN